MNKEQRLWVRTQVASIFKKGKDAIRKGRKNNGTCKSQEKPQSMGQTEMENEIWQEVFGDWGKIFTREGYQVNVDFGYARTTAAKEKVKQQVNNLLNNQRYS